MGSQRESEKKTDEARAGKGANSDLSAFKTAIDELVSALNEFLQMRSAALQSAIEICAESLRAGGTILLFGNGGSAAEAQHFAAEMVNKLAKDRRALPALALTTDTSCLTAVGNDAGFERVFSRQVEALGRKGDVAVALTTSGTSANIVEGLKAAKAKGLVTVALTGCATAAVAALSDHLLDVPSSSTARIQEVHLVLLHLLAAELEERLTA